MIIRCYSPGHLVLQMQPHVISMGLRQGSGLCSSSSRKYPGTEGTNQNRHWNHHRWHYTNTLERTRLSCWCFVESQRVHILVRYVTKTWSVVLLNKKTHILLSQVYCVWQVVKTPTVISNNPVHTAPTSVTNLAMHCKVADVWNYMTLYYICTFNPYQRL